MRRSIALSLGLTIVMAACGSTTPEPGPGEAASTSDVLTYRGDVGRTGRMPGPGPEGQVGVQWTFQADAPIGSQVVVVDGLVVIAAVDGALYGLDLRTGAMRWHAELGAVTRASPAVVEGLVLIAADDGVHAVHLSDGVGAWTATNTGIVRGTPAVIDDLAIVVSTSGLVSALDVLTGAPRWTLDLDASDDTSIAADDGIAVIGLASGIVVGLDVSDGTEQWRTDTEDPSRIGTPTIADGRVFVVTLDGREPETSHHVAALDLATGHLLWRVATPGDEPTYSPAVVNDLAISGSEAGTMVALAVESGATRWQVPAPGVVEVVTAVAGETVYSASNGGMAFALDSETGSERWRVPIEGVPYGVAVTSGLVLVGTNAGLLYAIGELPS